MSQLTKNCPLCHGGIKREGKTTFTVDLGFGVVVIRKVPAQVCDQCNFKGVRSLDYKSVQFDSA